MLTVISVGQEVSIGLGSNEPISAVITGVLIRSNNHICYEVSWWNGRSHECKTIESCEILLDRSPSRTQIGFAN